MRRSGRSGVLIGTGAFLLLLAVLISGWAGNDISTRPTLTHQVFSTGTLVETGERRGDDRSSSDASSRGASDPIETIRIQLIRLLTINSLLTTHVAVIPR